MDDEPNKFICLAEYWCRCSPVGKPVDESTMRRHREAANKLREKHGLGFLPRGLRYSAYREREQYHRRQSMKPLSCLSTSEESVEEAAQESQNGAHGFHYVSDPIQSLNTPPSLAVHDDRGADMMSADIHPSSGPEGAILGVLDTPTFNQPLSATDYEIDVVEREETIQMVEDQSFQGDTALEIAEILDEAVDVALPVWRPTVAARFTERAVHSQQWLKLFVDKGISQEAMKCILQLLEAPYALITVRRNIFRYSELSPVRYRTCRGHMLTGKEFEDWEQDNRSCDVCKELGTEPDYCVVEYFPILPRLKSWDGNEERCNTLFGYLQEKISERVRNTNSFQNWSWFEDVIEGQIVRTIAEKHSGLGQITHDIILAPSCDGFQTFAKRTYDCWPIVAISHNLHPSNRLRMGNVIPLMFIHGPNEPKSLDTLFQPLLEEILEINKDGGTALRFFDGSQKLVRLIVPMQTGDGPAVAKTSGISGANGKHCCRFCEVEGFRCPISGHYYVVSKVTQPSNHEGLRTLTIYDIDNPPMRTPASIKRTLNDLESGEFSDAEKLIIMKETGVRRRTVLHKFPDIIPFVSFPLGTMHLFMTIAKDLMELHKGENKKMIARGYGRDAFIICEDGWKQIDKEIAAIPKGTSHSAFGKVPRASGLYRHWKAAEYRAFFSYFAVILFDGHLQAPFMRGLLLFSRIIDYCSRPALNTADLDQLDSCSKEFVVHFEQRYYMFNTDRASLCKSTIRALLHLVYLTKHCGPLVNCNHFWIERYVGYVKHRLHATYLAAESLAENAKFLESYMLYFDDPFIYTDSEESDDNGKTGNRDANNGIDKILLGHYPLAPVQVESLQDPYHRKFRTKGLLQDYLNALHGISNMKAVEATSEDALPCFGRMKITCRDRNQVVGAIHGRRHRQSLKRTDCYIAAEFASSRGDSYREVYYGRLLKIIKYRFRTHSWCKTELLAFINWASGLRINSVAQLYRSSSIPRSFNTVTAQKATVIQYSVGVLEHRSPTRHALRK